ncbi:MAG: sigma-70 family RNA polymerase sigma factor [Bernardetiaceae bacterium]|nr:sigma-70 family RNA polymerase sigma factor [Bernardetiaceae bacterium]
MQEQIYDITQAQRGDAKAFDKLAKYWYPCIYRFAFRYFGDEDMAAECTQQTFIIVHKKIRTLENPERFKAWIYRVANNAAHALYQKQKRRNWLSFFGKNQNNEKQDLHLQIPDTEKHANPDSLISQKELSDMLQKALKLIPEEQRVVVVLKNYEGLKFSEISEATGENLSTVKSRLYYGLEALRKILTKWNIQKETIYHEI